MPKAIKLFWLLRWIFQSMFFFMMALSHGIFSSVKLWNLYTVGCRYGAIKYNMILLHRWGDWGGIWIKSLDPQKTTKKTTISRPNVWAMWCVLQGFLKKWSRYSDTAAYQIMSNTYPCDMDSTCERRRYIETPPLINMHLCSHAISQNYDITNG